MINIAIDGPSGAGKSTIAKILAKKLRIIYLDTGAMYRAVALAVLDAGYEINDKENVIKVLNNIKLEIKYSDNQQYVYLNGSNVSTRIREHHISQAASDVSKYPEVRVKLVEMQREIAAKNNVVLDGRDITSYVLPNAQYKFFLTADVEERAKRRCDELTEKGSNIEYQTVLDDIKKRDANDMNRAFAPLVKTEDSILIDTTHMTIDEVAAKIITYIKLRG